MEKRLSIDIQYYNEIKKLSLGIFYIQQGARIFALLGGFWGICGGFSCFRFNEWNYILGGILRM